MLVFIDDSGDPGFKLGKGSSKFFIICAVIFDDDLEAEKTALAIKELRRELFGRDDVEFKFHKSKKSIRESFLKKINGYQFRVRCVVADNGILYSPKLRNSRDTFYSYMIKMLLKYNDHTIVDAKIRIDGGGDRVFRRNFITYLRRELNGDERKVLQNCKMIDSKKDVLIQMADMIAGSIHRSLKESKSDSLVYKAIIKKHIEDEWSFR